MKNKLYYGCTIIITALLITFFLLIATRVFSKEVLIDRLDIKNEFISMIADYYWGDYLSYHPEPNSSPGHSEHYNELRELYNVAYNTVDVHASNDNSDTIISVTVTPPMGILSAASAPGLTFDLQTKPLSEVYLNMVNELKSDINHYCNYHFVLRPYLTDIKRYYYASIGWNMAYARTSGANFMMKNGVIYLAQEEQNSAVVNTTLKDLAEKYGIHYLFVQAPFRVTTKDTYVPYGVENYYNENADMKLQAIKELGGDVLDLRSGLSRLEWNPHFGFYLADGHWKTDTGFLAAGLIAEYLSKTVDGFVYNEDFHNASSYNILSVDLNNPMLREKVNIYLPAFNTYFQMIRIFDDAEKDTETEGDFSHSLFNLKRIEEGHFSNILTAYSSSNISSDFTEITNHMDTPHYGTVLFVSNSFSWHVIPYLAIDCDKVYFITGDRTDNIETFIDALRPDVLIEM